MTEPVDVEQVIASVRRSGSMMETIDVSDMTAQQLVAEMRVVPYGYRVVITHEPSMLQRGKEATMVTLWYGKEMLTRHLHYV